MGIDGAILEFKLVESGPSSSKDDLLKAYNGQLPPDMEVRRPDAVPRRDRLPPLGDDPGEARDAEGLERRPRRARVLPLAVRHLPHPLGSSNSIHSFAQSDIGPWFLAFIVIAVVFSTALIIWRLPLLRSTTRLESLVSREAVFLYNNLLLVALCLTILWGVAWPILSEAVRGDLRRRRPSLLRLLPPHLRAAVAAADGRRAADRLAARVAARAREDVPRPFVVEVVAGVVLLILGAGRRSPA